MSILLVFPVNQLLVLLINFTTVSNSLISTCLLINSLNNHTILPLADGLFDSKSAGTGVSLWWCVISNRETITTKAYHKYFLELHHILPGPIHKQSGIFSIDMLEPCPIILYAEGFPVLQWATWNANSKKILHGIMQWYPQSEEQIARGDLRFSSGKLWVLLSWAPCF